MAGCGQDRPSIAVGWEELHRHARALAWRLVDLGPWQGIVAITRGGMVPAAIIARELGLRLVDTLCISSYEHQSPGEPRVLKNTAAALDYGEGWLVVDDLVDSGRTAAVVRALLPRAHIATIFAKPAGLPLINSFVAEVDQDTWVFFPWDIEPQFIPPLVERRRPEKG